eukprot:2454939-Ditylum_brightwellii.AAC.1
MSSTGPARVPATEQVLVYKYLLNHIVKNSFSPWYHRNSYSTIDLVCTWTVYKRVLAAVTGAINKT